MLDLNTSFRIDGSFYDGLRTNLEYSTMVRIFSVLVVAVALVMKGLLGRSMRTAKREDVASGRDITFRGGPDELLAEMQILIGAKEWSKVRRGLWHAFIVVWILLLPTLLTQFGKWKRDVCLSNVSIIDTEDDNITDWFKSTNFSSEQTARVGLTFRHNLGIGMTTNATGTNGVQIGGKADRLRDSVIYSFKQCLYWTGNSYDGCESGEEIKETFDSTVRVVPIHWPAGELAEPENNAREQRDDIPYLPFIEFYEKRASGGNFSIKCLRGFGIGQWVCTFKVDNAWHVADLLTKKKREGRQFSDVETLKLEGISMEDGEWVWYAGTLAAEINAGGFAIQNVKDAQQLAMLYARFNYLLHGEKQVCKVIQEESFVVSYIWIGILTITTALALNMGWSTGRHINVRYIPMKSFEWYMYFAREQEGRGGPCTEAPDMCYYHKKFSLSPGAVPLSKQEDMDVELPILSGVKIAEAQSNGE